MNARQSVLMVVFAGSLFLLWDAWVRQSATSQPQASVNPSVSAAAPGAGQVDRQKSTELPTVKAGNKPSTASLASGVAAAGTSSLPLVVLRGQDLQLSVSPEGGRLVKADLLDQPSQQYAEGVVRLLDESGPSQFQAQSGLVGQAADGRPFPSHLVVYQRYITGSAEERAGRALTLRAESGGLRLEKQITVPETGHAVKVVHRIENTGSDRLTPSLYLQLVRTDVAAPGESQFYNTFTGPAVYTEAGKFQKIAFSDIEKGRQNYETQAKEGWLGMVQHYFVTAWVPGNADAREFYSRKLGNKLYSVGVLQTLAELAPGAKVSHEATLYVGPQEQRTLSQLANGLDLVVDYGWLTFIAKPIYWLLDQLNKVVNNYGWAIVLLTVIIKALFYPLSAAGYRSMARMKDMAPRLKALQERYADDKPKLNQAMMELYRTEKINPLGGCLPVVVQIPVFLALYWVLLASVEMRNAPWVLWINDLSSPDPYYILPVVMAVTMFIQTKLNPPPPDPVQAKVMMVMPLVFSVFFFFFPAGLVLYWLVNNVISISQQWFIMRRMKTA